MSKGPYRQPPKDHQFKPGQSGNPKGRPKGSKGLSTILDKALSRRISIKGRDREKRVTVTEALVLRLIQKSLGGGDLRSIAYLLDRVREPAQAEPTDLSLSPEEKRSAIKSPTGVGR